jgi:HNH endonuclease
MEGMWNREFVGKNNEIADSIRKGPRKPMELPCSMEAPSPNMNVALPVFLQSKQWIRLRQQAIRYYGKTCMKCGRTANPPNVDHIKPRARFPHLALEFKNLQILCRRCNKHKGNTEILDWRQSYVSTRIDDELNARFRHLIGTSP